MKKKFLFIVDPLPRLNVKTDTTLALIQEACERGYQCYACEIGDISLRGGKAHFSAASVHLEPNYEESPAYREEKRLYSADDFAAIFMRKDPPVDQLFFSVLLMLRCYDPKKTLMVNEPDGLLVANEKLFGLAVAEQFYPPTEVAAQAPLLQDFAARHGRIVIKPLFGAGGSGVLVFDKGDMNLSSALELLTANFSIPIMAQSYIPNARRGDMRILLVGGELLGAVLRVPHGQDHRANFHAGGRAAQALVGERERSIIEHLKPILVAKGLHFVGIDVIEGYLTEINVTSPTCLLEMESLANKKLRNVVIDYVEQRLPRH